MFWILCQKITAVVCCGQYGMSDSKLFVVGLLLVHILIRSEHVSCQISNISIVSRIYWSITHLSKLLIFS